MKIIILEGIATSGKTSLKEKLSEYFGHEKLKVKIIDEEITLMPILHNTDKKVSLELLNHVINDSLKEKADVVIFDRLYFTHIFRTKSSLSDFSAVEDLLLAQNALLVLLTIKKETIGQRIFDTMKRRGESWSKYVRSKGTDDEIVSYYTNQQEELINLVNESKLDSISIDVTDRDYNVARGAVIEKLIQVKETDE